MTTLAMADGPLIAVGFVLLMLGGELVALPTDSVGRARWLESARALVDQVHGGSGGGE